ncbi:hypothetical protein Ga0100231_003465 [Opitutaceae bacterium TAV4]|nr:hypothetical protein Ga0100231_003465 [Opitutaceae bacterium TAV4]RRK01957.1 hypothetical protein Ga0100230_001690 [Opitutaceae bacterium TAV3]
MNKILMSLLFTACVLPLSAQVQKNPTIKHPEEPFTFINLMEIKEADIDRFVADWNERSKIMGQLPGYITATLYKSLLADSQYQLITVGQWQSYDAWVAANNNPTYAQQLSADLGQAPSIKLTRGFYRPTASSVHVYRENTQQITAEKKEPLQRAKKDPNIKNSESPFVFINLMEMDQSDIPRFVSDWKVRSKVMGQMPAAIGSTLYRSLLPDNRHQIINVSNWQSYDGFIAANNDPTYAQELTNDLARTTSIKLTRGFYRPIASYTHIYGDADVAIENEQETQGPKIINVKDLSDVFKNNPEEAIKKYRGKFLTVRGIARYIGPDIYALPSIELTDKEGGEYYALCVFPVSDYLKLTGVKKGQEVVITGEFRFYADVKKDKNIMGFKQCKIISIK